MKLNRYKILSSALLLTVIFSCNKADVNGIIGDNKVPPGPVSNVQVKNENGQSRITYSLPSNRDLLYIKAVYTTASGAREVIASNYTNNLLVDGFSDTKAYEVKLYAVNKSEVASEPVTITVNPLTPPFKLAFDELRASATFGGVRLRTTNKYKANLVIVPLIDSLGNGDWANLENFYTQDSVINYSVRGLAPKSAKFSFYVRDRWLNRSETLNVTLTPLEENLLDKSIFKGLNLPGDATYAYDTRIDMIWDKNFDPGRWPSLYTSENAGEPQSLSFDLGKAAKMSRIVIFPRREAGFYDKGNLRDFEIWGSNEYNIDGSWASWTKVMSCTVIKPSGSPSGTDTGADEAYGRAGWSFDVPEDAPKYRYLRIKNLRNWRGSYFIQMAQISVWGVY